MMWMGGLSVKVYSNSLLIWEPLCHSDVFLCSCAKCQILLPVGFARQTGFKFWVFWFFFWKSLYKFLEIVVKGSRNRDSHSFNIHLKSVHFMLVGPLTCHQAGLYIKQNLKLFVAYMCLILVKDRASNAVFIHRINQP